MPSNIFSIYATPENRVTASIVAVLQSLTLSRIDRLLNALLQSTDFTLVEFENQIAGEGNSVPDARIRSNSCILLETKVVRGAVNKGQLLKHLTRLGKGDETIGRLLVLTPDEHQPIEIDQIQDARIAWASFVMFDQAINELLLDPQEVVSEREAFLLRELQALFASQQVLGNAKAVLVVPARNAWPEYQKYSAYICQPDRTFQDCQWIAFYADGEIKPIVARIKDVQDRVAIEPTLLTDDQRHLEPLVSRLISDGARPKGTHNKIMLLSGPVDVETVTLDSAIPNNIRSATGKPWAFVLQQRYVDMQSLQSARLTSDLV
jgi:hypothetical protein